MADDVQPAGEPEGVEPDGGAGQGDEATGGLYDLSSVPENLREHVEPHLKAIEGNATRKFQDAAEYRRSWEPYEQLGINQMDPEALGELLSFAQMAEDNDAFASWFEQVGNEIGLFEQLGYSKAGAGAAQEDSFGSEDDGLFGMTPDQVKELVAEAVSQQVDPLRDEVAQTEQQRAEDEAYSGITGQLTQIRQDNPDMPEEAEGAILRLAFAHAEDGAEDPVSAGFDEYQAIVAQGESGLFKQKASQPKPVEGPGSADTSPDQVRTFDEAKKAAKEYLAGSRGA